MPAPWDAPPTPEELKRTAAAPVPDPWAAPPTPEEAKSSGPSDTSPQAPYRFKGPLEWWGEVGNGLLTGAAHGISSGTGFISRTAKNALFYPEDLDALEKDYQKTKSESPLAAGAGNLAGTAYTPENAMIGQAIGMGIGAALKPAAKTLEEYAGGALWRQLGGGKGTIKSPISGSGVMGGEERARQAALELKDMGILGAFTRPGKALERIQEAKGVVGGELGGVLPNLDAKLAAAGRTSDPAVNVDMGNVLTRIQHEIIDPLRGSGVKDLQRVADEVEGQAMELAGLAKGGQTIPLSRAHQLRRDLDLAIFRNNKNPWMGSLSTEEKAVIRDIIDDELGSKIEAAGQAVGTGAEGAQWANLNRRYSSLAIGQRAAEEGARKAAGNHFLGLREIIAMAPQLATGNIASAVETAAAAKGLSAYGPGVTGSLAYRASKALGGTPEASLSKVIGPAAATAVPSPQGSFADWLRGLKVAPAAARATPTGSGTPAQARRGSSTAASDDRTWLEAPGQHVTGAGQDPANHFERWITDPNYRATMREPR